MIDKTRALIVTVSFAVTPSMPAVAHHGSAGLFDETRTVEVTGTVKEWRFVNPHPVLILDVTGENGTKNPWDIYFGPAAVSFLKGRGYQADSFKAGEQVIVTGHPAATGTYAVDVFGPQGRVTRPDGTRIPQ